MINLTRCLIFAASLAFIASCEKQTLDTQGKLISFKDATRSYSLRYEGSKVTHIRVDSGASAPFIIASYSYSPDYIKATLHPSTGYTYVEYYLKKGVLPLNIVKHKDAGGVDKIVSRTQFFYKKDSDLLDSVVLTNSSRLTFIPIYSGGNISDYYLAIDNRPPVLSGSFLYYPVINVFRTTNPLLYVYSSPVFEFESFLMPRIFSQQTMKKFNGGSFRYDTDSKGNLAVEDYGPSVYPYKRIYTYE